ncbi:MAG: hypothetical protein QOG45_2272 [Chloroflexota bacterium]|nr:hypothetical protein [Chloroflexota bacterium]
MWESNVDSSAGEEPGGHEPDRAPAGAPSGVPAAPHAEVVEGAPPPAAPWRGPVLRGVSTPRVFSALASAARTPSNGATSGVPTPEPEAEPLAEDEDGGDLVDDDGQLWSPEAAAARMRARQRWREIEPGAPLPSLTLTQEEAAALLPPVEQPLPEAAPQPTTTAAPRQAAPWLPAPVPGQAAAPATSFGPPGRRRAPAMVVLLSVLTLGFYALWWHHRVNREMAEFDPRMSVDAGRSTWAVAIPLIIGWMVAAGAGARYLLALAGTPTADLPISAEQSLFLALSPFVVPYLELLLPFSAAAVVMTHERARIVEDRVDTPTGQQLRPVSALGWLTVPVIGGLVGMARMQQHLNGVWRAVSS